MSLSKEVAVLGGLAAFGKLRRTDKSLDWTFGNVDGGDFSQLKSHKSSCVVKLFIFFLLIENKFLKSFYAIWKIKRKTISWISSRYFGKSSASLSGSIPQILGSLHPKPSV